MCKSANYTQYIKRNNFACINLTKIAIPFNQEIQAYTNNSKLQTLVKCETAAVFV